MVIDNYLYDKTKVCGNLKLHHEIDLINLPKNTPIILFTRSSTNAIKKNLVGKGFKNIFDFLRSLYDNKKRWIYWFRTNGF